MIRRNSLHPSIHFIQEFLQIYWESTRQMAMPAHGTRNQFFKLTKWLGCHPIRWYLLSEIRGRWNSKEYTYVSLYVWKQARFKRHMLKFSKDLNLQKTYFRNHLVTFKLLRLKSMLAVIKKWSLNILNIIYVLVSAYSIWVTRPILVQIQNS